MLCGELSSCGSTALPQSGLVQASSWTSCWIPTRNPGSGLGLRFQNCVEVYVGLAVGCRAVEGFGML